MPAHLCDAMTSHGAIPPTPCLHACHAITRAQLRQHALPCFTMASPPPLPIHPGAGRMPATATAMPHTLFCTHAFMPSNPSPPLPAPCPRQFCWPKVRCPPSIPQCY